MNKYYIKCECHEITGYKQEDGDGSRYSGFSHTVCTDHKFSVYKKPIDYPEATIETDVEDPHFVAVIYGDGGTFGRTDGYVQILNKGFTEEEAEKVCQLVKKSAKKDSYMERNNKEPKEAYKELEKLINDKNFYASWIGYFSSLEKCCIIRDDGYVKDFE